MATSTAQLSTLIDDFRAITQKDAITPSSLGYILKIIAEQIDIAQTADVNTLSTAQNAASAAAAASSAAAAAQSAADAAQSTADAALAAANDAADVLAIPDDDITELWGLAASATAPASATVGVISNEEITAMF